MGNQYNWVNRAFVDNGVVHGDIKPHNLLLNEDGIVKIGDWRVEFLLRLLLRAHLRRAHLEQHATDRSHRPPEARLGRARRKAHAW